MAEQSSEMLIQIQNESDNSQLVPVVVESAQQKDLSIYNELPPDIFGKILSHLAQNELVVNRSVSRYWRDVIDYHCTMKVIFRRNDKFLERKLLLRIRDCEMFWFTENINFTFPQIIRSIKFYKGFSPQNINRLLTQVKPYVTILTIDTETLEEEAFVVSPFELIPQLKQIRFQGSYTTPRFLNFDITFCYCHPVLLLTNIQFEFHANEFHTMDFVYNGFFNFLGSFTCRQFIKRLDLNIQLKIDETDETQQVPDVPRVFELPGQLQNLLYDGTLQLEYFHITFQSRYIFTWARIIQSQKKLIDLSVKYDNEFCVDAVGVPFSMICPGIKGSIATLRILCLKDILSVGDDGITWIPFDCAVFKDAVNLRELKLYRNTNGNGMVDTPWPINGIEGAGLINLGEIPVKYLKKLEIHDFFCDSGELQMFVDNAGILEHLGLIRTVAPCSNARFGLTGPHGGIVLSFVEKCTKRWIGMDPINYFNQEENSKFDKVKVLCPCSHFGRYIYKFG